MSLAEDEDVIQTLAPDGADEALCEGVLPRAVRRREKLLDSHALYAIPELLTIDLVTIPEEVSGGGVVREGVDELLSGPLGGGVLGDVKVHDPPAVVSEHDEDKEDDESSGAPIRMVVLGPQPLLEVGPPPCPTADNEGGPTCRTR